MNELNGDKELQSILEEARENYQKRIKNLKSSISMIYSEPKNDPVNKMTTQDFNLSSSRQNTELSRDLLQSLSKIQILQIENENLKKILKNDRPEEKNLNFYHQPHYKKNSFDSNFENFSNSDEILKLKDLASLSERENKELKHMIERLKLEKNELEEISFRNRKKIKEIGDENLMLKERLCEFEGFSEKYKFELEKLRGEIKEKAQIIARLQNLETEKMALEREFNKCRRFSDFSSYEEIRAHYKAKIERHKKNTQALESQLLKKNEEMSDLQDNLKCAHEDEISRAQKEFVEKKEKLSCEIDDLQQQLAKFQGKINEYEQENKYFNEKIKDQSETIEKLTTKNQEFQEMLYKNNKLLSETIIDYDTKLKTTISNLQSSFQSEKNELLTQLETEKSQLKLLSSNFSEKSVQSQEKIEKLEGKLAELRGNLSDLEKKLKESLSHNQSLEQDFLTKSQEFQDLYSKEIAQHKSDVNILELEVQKLYETKGKFNSESEILKEKYNILKKEHLDLQQKYHINFKIHEKQIEEFKKNYAIQEKEIEYLRKKEIEKDKNIEEYEKEIEKLLSEIRKSEEGKIEFKSMALKFSDELKSEKNKISKLKELFKVCIKQIKNEFFQNMKKMHRSVFEDFMNFKKTLGDSCQILISKLIFNLKSIISGVEMQKTQQKVYQDQYFRDSEEYNSMKLKTSQYLREICIRDERISYLENALKSSFVRNKVNEQEILKGLLAQVLGLEENYSQSYNEMIESMVNLKSLIQKDFMDAHNKTLERF